MPSTSDDTTAAPAGEARFRRSQQPTPHLFIGGSVRQLQVLLQGQHYSLQTLSGRLFATFESAEAAQRAHAALSSAGVFNGYSELFLPDPPAPEPEAELQVPAALEAAGLRLHCDVVTAAEEAALLAEIDAAPWDCSIHRRVQHFGERFDYITKTVGATRPPPLPAWLAPVLEMVRARRAVPWAEAAAADGRVQVTVNEYVPGVGIASHVDTHSAFEDGIAALSLGAGIGMKLQPTEEATAEPAAAAAAGHVLWLPPRSLLVFGGAARYAWRHGIASKKGDRLPGGWAPRGRRVSVTLRRVRAGGAPCRCAWPRACDSQGAALQLPTRIGAGPRSTARSETVTTAPSMQQETELRPDPARAAAIDVTCEAV